MSVTSGATEARLQLNAIINAEFAPENFVVINDHLHESLGNGGTRLGTSPNRSRPLASNDLVMTHEILFQFYGRWKDDIDPTTKVDPLVIETYAERFMRALEASAHAGTDRMWYYRVTEINYPQDPTGNKTRFEATILAYGNNPVLVETTG